MTRCGAYPSRDVSPGRHQSTELRRLDLGDPVGGGIAGHHRPPRRIGVHRAECNGSDERRTELGNIIALGTTNRVKDRCDNVVHAFWWTFDGCGVRRARYFRKKPDAPMMATFADLDEDAALLFHYAAELDRLLGNDWPIATLPRVRHP